MDSGKGSICTFEEFMDGVPTDAQAMAEDLRIFREAGLFSPQISEDTQRAIERVARGESEAFKDDEGLEPPEVPCPADDDSIGVGTVAEYMDGVPGDRDVMDEHLRILRECGLLESGMVDEARKAADRVRRGASRVFAARAELTEQQDAEEPRLSRPETGEQDIRNKSRRWPLGIAISILAAAICYLIWSLVDFNRVSVARLQDEDNLLTVRSGPTAVEVSGIDAYPQLWQQDIRKMLAEQKVDPAAAQLPFLAGTQRGHGQTIYETPVNTVVKEQRPTFRWRLSDRDDRFQVIVFEKQKEFRASEELAGNEWVPQWELERGKVYQWELVVLRKGKHLVSDEPRPTFQVLEEKHVAELEAAEVESRNRHLARVCLYLRYGLLDAAQKELAALVEANPDSHIASALLKSFIQSR